MADKPGFRVITLPILGLGAEQDAGAMGLVEKFRELRLRSLQKAPDAFASKYEDEVKRGHDHTLNRLSNPKAIHFVAVKDRSVLDAPANDSGDIQAILDAEWLGFIVLLGPQDDDDHQDRYPKRDPFQRMTAAAREDAFLSSDKEVKAPSVLHFHLNGMFVDPVARGSGLGIALIQAAIEKAKAEAASLNVGMRATICVYDHNVVARTLYEKAGFIVVERRPSLTRGPEITTADMELEIPVAT